MITPPFPPLVRFEAAIFDMDGLLLDSEPLWKRAEREAFSEVGIHISEEMAKVTAPMTTAEVAAHWYRFCPWTGRSTLDLELAVIDRVRNQIDCHAEALPGVRDSLRGCRSLGLRTGLASNSPLLLCNHVVQTLRLQNDFDAVVSAEQVARGKPAPDVYLEAARAMGVSPMRCLAFEDSVSGVRAALEAGMTVVAVPSGGQVFDAGSAPHAIFPTLSAFVKEHLLTRGVHSEAPTGTARPDF